MDNGLMIPANQKGGGMLGSGVYGCIFTPPLKCRGSTRQAPKGKLGKVTDKEDVKSEILAARIFANKPESKKYLILPELDTFCTTLSPFTEQKEKDISKCQPLEGQSLSDMVQFEVPYGGKTLHGALDTKLRDLKVIVAEFPFYDFIRDMLETGAYLALHGFIHNDLHSNNILVNKSYHPRLIDFGRSYSSHAITQELIEEHLLAQYAPGIGQIPPEVTIIDGLDEGIPLQKMLDDIRKDKPAIEYVEKILGISRYQQIAELALFLNSSKAYQSGDFPTFMQLYWPVVDSWAIGHNILSILRKLLLSKEFAENPEWKRRRGPIKHILRGLLKTSPRDRLDSVEALAMYDPMNAVLLSPSGKAWLKQKQQQRASKKP
jgi:serine/threonine protein kinase